MYDTTMIPLQNLPWLSAFIQDLFPPEGSAGDGELDYFDEAAREAKHTPFVFPLFMSLIQGKNLPPTDYMYAKHMYVTHTEAELQLLTELNVWLSRDISHAVFLAEFLWYSSDYCWIELHEVERPEVYEDSEPEPGSIRRYKYTGAGPTSAPIFASLVPQKFHAIMGRWFTQMCYYG